MNSLNAVRALIKKKENERAEEICDGLCVLLQYANAGDATISLLDEFSVLEQYLAIMRARYPGKFTTSLEFDDALAEVQIPRMLLQPLVENAILHGFQSREGGAIHIFCESQPEGILLRVADNGCGMDEETLQALQARLQSQPGDDMAQGLSHVALPNIQKRIQANFGPAYGVRIESRQGKGTTVTVTLPSYKEQ